MKLGPVLCLLKENVLVLLLPFYIISKINEFGFFKLVIEQKY